MKAHVILAASTRGPGALDRLLASLAPAAPAFVQLREKELAGRALLELARHARAALPASTALLVNGRPDVAIAAGAQGVQLPADGLPPREVRRAFPRPFLIGVSCHSLEEVADAAAGGADFALLAPIYAPSSKPGDVRPALGPEVLDAFSQTLPLPIHVLGGLTLERIAAWPEARRTRAEAAAGIGIFADAADPGAVVRSLAALGGA